ncbi:MAG: hypothetical protein O2894_06985 [Planctomycetota bacterium]|nr:hypothetical protein [Planctomycetota bacterium]
MEALRFELERLAADRARGAGGARASRLHFALLVGACLLAFAHRTLLRVPGFDGLQASWPLLLGVAAGIWLFGPALRLALARLLRPSPRRIARDLDDRHGWRDETETATGLVAREPRGALDALLLAQAGGRLRELPTTPHAGWRWRRVRLALALLFVALLMLPGVDGLLGGRGAGARGGEDLGSSGAQGGFGAPAPMAADLWMQGFVENPIAVEPLPADGLPADVPVVGKGAGR